MPFTETGPEELLSETSYKSWDQFEEWKRMEGRDSTYTEDEYTIPLHKVLEAFGEDKEDKQREAARVAWEIEITRRLSIR